MAFPELYVLRHGQTEWNLEGRLQGALDSPLTETGVAQAIRQREIMSTIDLDGLDVICSPQGRARRTADIVFEGRDVSIQFDPRLTEIGVGDWAGKTREARRSDLPEGVELPTGPAGDIALYDHAPGGEGLSRLRARLDGFLKDRKRPSVIVTHGVTSRMLRAIWLGLENSSLDALPGGQGNVFHLRDDTQFELT